MRTIPQFKQDCENGNQNLYSDDTLLKLCANAQDTAIVMSYIPKDRQYDLLRKLDIYTIFKDSSDFYRIYDVLDPENKLYLMFNIDNSLGIKEKLIKSDLRLIDDQIINDYIIGNVLNGRNNYLMEIIKNDPASFLTIKFEIEKFQNNPPNLSAWESTFQLFYQEKINAIQMQLTAINWLDGLINGEYVYIDDNINTYKTILAKISPAFSSNFLDNLITYVINQNEKNL